MSQYDDGIDPIVYPIFGVIAIIVGWIVLLYFPCEGSSSARQCTYSYIGGYTRTGDCPGEACTQLYLAACGAIPSALGFGLVAAAFGLGGLVKFFKPDKPDPRDDVRRKYITRLDAAKTLAISIPIFIACLYTLIEFGRYLL